MLLPETQLYALFFLMGCFTVKSLLELYNWAGRKDMSELWVTFIAVLLVHDVLIRPDSMVMMGVKWGSIVLGSLFFYLKDLSFIFKGDKIAVLAGLSVLQGLQAPLLFLLYLAVVLAFKRRLKHDFSHSDMVPTLPVATVTLVVTLIIFILI